MAAAPSPSTREKILDTALALLTELGYDKLTQPQVAKAAAVSQGHLTYYFPTRSDLLLAVAEHSLRASMAQFLERKEKASAAPGKATAIVRRALLDKNRTRTILGLVVASDRDKEIKKPLREMIVHARALAAGLLEALGAEPCPGQATLLHACLVGLSVITFALDNASGDKEMGEAATQLLHLMAKAGSAKPARRPASARTAKSRTV